MHKTIQILYRIRFILKVRRKRIPDFGRTENTRIRTITTNKPLLYEYMAAEAAVSAN